MKTYIPTLYENHKTFKYIGMQVFMVEIKEIRKGSKKYFYLVHSFREGKSVKKKQSYLGESVPENIEEKNKNLLNCLKIKVCGNSFL